MTSARKIRAGRAFVEIGGDSKSLERVLKRAQQRLATFGKGLLRIGAIGTAAGAAFAPFGIAVVRAASDAEEALSRFRAVFKSETEAAAAFAEELANRIGRSSLQIKDALGIFQSFFVGLGFGGPQSRRLSQELTSLALDFASFNNIADDEAIGRFISALSGSSEVLDRFGINIKQAALQQQLLADGVNKSWTEVTEQEKAIARLNIIMRAMGDQGSVGDATRTAGSFANVMKRLRGEIRTTAVAIGQSLVPILKPVVAGIGGVLGLVRQWAEQNQVVIGRLVLLAAGATAAAASVIGAGLAVTLLSVAFGGLVTAVTFAQAVLAPVLLTIGSFAVIGIGVVAALAGISAAFGGLGNAALVAGGIVRGAFATIDQDVVVALRSIVANIASGNIEGASRVLWATMRVIWAEGVESVLGIMQGLVLGSLELIGKAIVGFRLALSKLRGDSLGDQLGVIADATKDVQGLTQGIRVLLDVLNRETTERTDQARENLRRQLEQAKRELESGEFGGGFSFDFGALGRQVRQQIETAGAFGGRVIERQFGGESTARQQLEEARKTSKNTEDTAVALGELSGRLVFG